MIAQRAEAGKAAAAARTKSTVSEDVSDTVEKPKGPKKDTRKTVAKEKNVSEWKLRTAQGIDKAGTEDAKKIDELIISGKVTLSLPRSTKT
jgi:hypothetical protein